MYSLLRSPTLHEVHPTYYHPPFCGTYYVGWSIRSYIRSQITILSTSWSSTLRAYHADLCTKLIWCERQAEAYFRRPVNNNTGFSVSSFIRKLVTGYSLILAIFWFILKENSLWSLSDDTAMTAARNVFLIMAFSSLKGWSKPQRTDVLVTDLAVPPCLYFPIRKVHPYIAESERIFCRSFSRELHVFGLFVYQFGTSIHLVLNGAYKKSDFQYIYVIWLSWVLHLSHEGSTEVSPCPMASARTWLSKEFLFSGGWEGVGSLRSAAMVFTFSVSVCFGQKWRKTIACRSGLTTQHQEWLVVLRAGYGGGFSYSQIIARSAKLFILLREAAGERVKRGDRFLRSIHGPSPPRANLILPLCLQNRHIGYLFWFFRSFRLLLYLLICFPGVASAFWRLARSFVPWRWPVVNIELRPVDVLNADCFTVKNKASLG